MKKLILALAFFACAPAPAYTQHTQAVESPPEVIVNPTYEVGPVEELLEELTGIPAYRFLDCPVDEHASEMLS